MLYGYQTIINSYKPQMVLYGFFTLQETPPQFSYQIIGTNKNHFEVP